MPAIVSGLRVHTPATVDEAVVFLADHAGEGWRPLAGGTDVMMGLYRDRRGGERWLNIARLRSELGRVEWDGDELRIGALATMAELRDSTVAGAAHPLIGEAASAVGAAQIQNRATVGGNIANGSPAGDTLPVWLALDAEVELRSQRGLRRVAFERFMVGYRHSVMEADELLTAVIVERPRTGLHCHLFRKVAPRAAQGISKVVFAATGMVDGSHTAVAAGPVGKTSPAWRWSGVRLAWGSMGPVTKRAYAAERCAEGGLWAMEVGMEAAKALEPDLSPIDDARSTAAYRMAVARNLTREFLSGNLGRIWRN